MGSFIPTLAICKQCRTRLSDPEEKEDVVLVDPKSQGETQRDEGDANSKQVTESASSRLSDPVEKDDVVLTDPKTQGETQREHSKQCTKTPSSEAEEPTVVSSQN